MATLTVKQLQERLALCNPDAVVKFNLTDSSEDNLEVYEYSDLGSIIEDKVNKTVTFYSELD